MTRRRRVRIALGLVLLAVSVPVLAWGWAPAPRQTRLQPVTYPGGLVLPEQRSLRLVYPPRIRAGDSGIARLTLELVGDRADPEADGFYTSHTVVVEARFDLPGIHVRPSELISVPTSRGQTPVFYWTLRPDTVGHFRGTLWLYLRVVNKRTGEERRETVSAQIVEVESVGFPGFPPSRARLLGSLGTSLGLILGLPFFESRIVSLIQNRTKNVKDDENHPKN